MTDDELRPYWQRRTELSSQNGCIVWGGRVVGYSTHRSGEFVSGTSWWASRCVAYEVTGSWSGVVA